MRLKQPRSIDQFCAGFAPGDAISHEALLLQRYLINAGFESRIYSQHFRDQDAHIVQHYTQFKDRKDSILVYHHSFYSDFLAGLRDVKTRKILAFHNMTPAHFVRPYSRTIADQLDLTRTLLNGLRHSFEIKLADSQYNARELMDMGFDEVKVMPVPIYLEDFRDGKEARLPFLEDGRRNILFVGRVFPNKRHQDLLKAFYYYHQIQPDSRLILVGDFHPDVRGYSAELINLAREMGIREHVLFTGKVPADEIKTYFRKADLFLSMSEHEGFFVPLVESMYMKLPILSFASSVIPETLGRCGVTFYKKDFPRIAAMMHQLVEDQDLRAAVIAEQNKRLSYFEQNRTYEVFREALLEMGVAQAIRA